MEVWFTGPEGASSDKAVAESVQAVVQSNAQAVFTVPDLIFGRYMVEVRVKGVGAAGRYYADIELACLDLDSEQGSNEGHLLTLDMSGVDVSLPLQVKTYRKGAFVADGVIHSATSGSILFRTPK